jgi:hypothetical protein
MDKVNISGTPIIGFFTFMMFWTLNANSGYDMADVVIKYVNNSAEIIGDCP